MKRFLAALLIAAAASAQAQPPSNVESSAVLKGSVVVSKDGSVLDVSINDGVRFDPVIVDFVRTYVSQVRFEPVKVDGQVVNAKAAMAVRVVLKELPSGEYNMRVKGLWFGAETDMSTDSVQFAPGVKQTPIHYPEAAHQAGVQGTVYLLLLIDRQGRVADLVAEQVNLRVTDTKGVRTPFRRTLADAAIRTAKDWKFVVPTTGKLASEDSWMVRVPVDFSFKVAGVPYQAPLWESYVPGPYTPAPWDLNPNGDAADAIVDGDLHTEGNDLKPLSSIDQG